MKKIKSVQEAFALENLDANNITITGVPQRHVEALKALAKLFVVHDHVNPDFNPDYLDYSQNKYETIWELGSPAGVGFSYSVFVNWFTTSHVGARLVSESSESARYIANHPEFSELFKNFMVYDRPEIK
jgi:hypothetical protein